MPTVTNHVESGDSERPQILSIHFFESDFLRCQIDAFENLFIETFRNAVSENQSDRLSCLLLHVLRHGFHSVVLTYNSGGHPDTIQRQLFAAHSLLQKGRLQRQRPELLTVSVLSMIGKTQQTVDSHVSLVFAFC